MTRRIEAGPVLVGLGALVLLVSLFLDWYGGLTAFQAFEVVEMLLAALAVFALVIVVGLLLPGLEYVDRRWLSAVVLAAAVLVAAEIIDPPPAAGGETATTGAWIAFGSALVMIAGAVLTLGRVSFAVSVEGREVRKRVAVVDHRQETTETEAVSPDGAADAPEATRRKRAVD
jgi:hypothetical protein